MEKCKSNLTKVRGPSFQLDINADTSPKKTNLMQFMNKSFSYFSQDDKIIIDCDRKNKDLTGFMTQDHISHKVMATNL